VAIPLCGERAGLCQRWLNVAPFSPGVRRSGSAAPPWRGAHPISDLGIDVAATMGSVLVDGRNSLDGSAIGGLAVTTCASCPSLTRYLSSLATRPGRSNNHPTGFRPLAPLALLGEGVELRCAPQSVGREGVVVTKGGLAVIDGQFQFLSQVRTRHARHLHLPVPALRWLLLLPL
jgi:hypothetical protein